jgi:hypothetical protein
MLRICELGLSTEFLVCWKKFFAVGRYKWLLRDKFIAGLLE